MTVIIYDLDDTLYEEHSFVQSGFRAVSEYIQNQYGRSQDEVFTILWEDFCSNGRGHVFDTMLKHFGPYSKKNVKKCLSIYRSHKPDITLDPDAQECLQRLSSYPQYIVTDGNKIVQNNKLSALKLHEQVKFCFITHRYGLNHAKPSPYCFFQIINRERVEPKKAVYIGDNPNKDFVGIKPFGFKTVRILKGEHRYVKKPAEFEADYQIRSLNELNERFLQTIVTN